MQKKLILLAAIMLLASLFVLKIDAQTMNHTDTRFMSYQGIIKNHDGTNADGKHKITLTMYSDKLGKNAVWRADYDVDIWNGYFNIILGGFRNPLPDNPTMDQPLWVGVRMEGGDEMRPLTQLVAAPYALNVPDQSITMAKLAPDVLLQSGHNPTPQAATAFHEITGDTNTTATMTVGSGALLRTSGTGTITANQYVGSGSTSNAVDLATAEVNGILPVANGGTGTSVVPWLGTGNSGTTPGTNYIGTTDSTAFEVHIFQSGSTSQGARRVMRFEPNNTSPNIIAGFQGNYVAHDSVGSFIGSGGMKGHEDSVMGNFSLITGGVQNFIGNSNFSAIVNGYSNSITLGINTSTYDTIRGPRIHKYPTIQTAGDAFDVLTHDWALSNIIGAGATNNITGGKSPVDAFISPNFDGILSGTNNTIFFSNNAFIGAGNNNTVGRDAFFNQGGGFVLMHVTTFNNCIVAGENNLVGGKTNENDIFLGAGNGNQALEELDVLGGGLSNHIGSHSAFIGGGEHNTISDEEDAATNTLPAFKSAIVGGELNTINSNDGFIGGGAGNAIGQGMTSSTKNTSDMSVVVGGETNLIFSFADHSFIGGGWNNQIIGTSTNTKADHTTIGGGYQNIIREKSSFSTIGGGLGNKIGIANSPNDFSTSTVSGGWNNEILTNMSFIGGGFDNHIKSGADGGKGWSSILGGTANIANGCGVSILGGVNNIVKTFGQVACGFWNEDHTTSVPQPSNVLFNNPWVSNTDAFNGQLFMIGNGHFVDGTNDVRRNAFEISYNGHAIVNDRNGSGATRASIRGGTYQDNVINAWGVVVGGAIKIDGSMQKEDFGVATIQHTSTGCYTIILNIIDPKNADNSVATQTQVTLSHAAITATNYYDNGSCVGVCNFLTVGPLGTIEFPGGSGVMHSKFTITLTHLTNQEGHPPCDVVDGDFMFHVVGRQ